MKRIQSILFCLLALLMQASVYANSFRCVKDGILYEADTDTKTASVVKDNNHDFDVTYSGDIVIPAKVTLASTWFAATTYTVTRIRSYSFEGADITSVTLPETIERLEQSSFWQCKKLKAVHLGKLNWIDPLAFSGCTPEQITVNASNQSYMMQDGMIFTKNKNKIVVCPSGLNREKYTIPEGVKTIGKYCFANNKFIKEVNLPASLTSIENNAFSSASLEKVGWNRYLTEIGDYAFSYSSIQDIKLPESLTSIGYQAFAYCLNLRQAAIPNGVKTLSGTFFHSGIESVKLPDGLESLGTSALSYCKLATITLPQSLKSIGQEAFAFTGIREIKLPEQLESIGEKAFASCQLQDISIPGSVSLIHADAFMEQRDEDDNNMALNIHFKNVYPPKTQIHTGWSDSNYEVSKQWEYENYIIHLPMANYAEDRYTYDEVWGRYKHLVCDETKGVVSKEDASMYEVVTQQKKLDKGYYVLKNGLKIHCDEKTHTAEVVWGVWPSYVPNGYTSCAPLMEIPASINVPDDPVPYTITKVDGFTGSPLKCIILPETAETLGSACFEKCKSLKRINLEKVTHIGAETFRASGITDFLVSEDNTAFATEDGVLFSKERDVLVTFPTARGGRYAIPNGTRTIAQSAFCENKKITDVECPSSLNTIEDNAFLMSGLKKITLREGLRKIGMRAFSDTNLTEMELPEGVEETGWLAFDKCRLRKITFPASIKSTGYPFNVQRERDSDATTSEQVTLQFFSETPPEGVEYLEVYGQYYQWNWDNNVLYVPNSPGVVEAYRKHQAWGKYKNIIPFDITGLDNISDSVTASLIYDLQGRQLQQKPSKGLYIQGKKKVLIK